MTRITNNKNVKIFKEIELGNFEETKRKIAEGEWKDMPPKVYTTRGRNDSKGPNTFLQEYKLFDMGGERKEEWKRMVQSQMRYLETGANKGTVKGEDQEAANWLPEPPQPQKKQHHK